MPPKPTKGKQVEGEQEKQVLQALVLADSFNTRFGPLTADTPRCLIPVCNEVLLDWTFESLALAGIEEIFVVCRSHTDKVKAHISKSKWARAGSPVAITPIVTQDTVFSIGAALRDVYAHQVIKGDFVLIMGDVVSNIDIRTVLDEHRTRRKDNKDAVMTIVAREAGIGHRSRPRGETSVFVLDSASQEVLHYAPVPAVPAVPRLSIPREKLQGHSSVEIRNDLIDCGIDVCAFEVLSLFQDEFDWQDVRLHFVPGILTSELHGKQIHVHVAKHGYAARVKDTKMYASVSKDILARWAFPLSPDENRPSGDLYEHLRGNRYVSRDKPISISRSCRFGNNSMIGGGSRLEDKTAVEGSVLGTNSVIGASSTVSNSFLWNDVKVGPGCSVESSILASGVTLLENTRLGRGCLVGEGVVLGPNIDLPAFSRISGERPEDEDDNDELVSSNDKTKIGANGVGWLWPVDPTEYDAVEEDDDEEPEIDFESPQNLKYLRIGAAEYAEDDCSDQDSNASTFSSPSSSVTSLPETDASGAFTTPGLEALTNASRTNEFAREARLTLDRAYDEDHVVENLAIELKTMRMSSNVQHGQVRDVVVRFLLDKVDISGDAAAQKASIERIVGRWGPLLPQLGALDGQETVTLLQHHCARPPYAELFAHILSTFYKHDVIFEEDVVAWHKQLASRGAEGSDERQCWQRGGQFVKYLASLESDDEEDEEEEEEEDEDEDDDSEEEK
ncbi:nucleotide-diphospho-sugar transferase [Auriculariales sp. MPI-PUGE-AT-0066]|nr:nucleotide-diphospho-sugar transferase [Auriculariales sp. MPI-PUGE-AT-0066]